MSNALVMMNGGRQLEFPIAEGLLPVQNLNPFDERGYAPHWMRFIRSRTDCTQLAYKLVPKVPSNDPFWANAARTIVKHVLYGLCRVAREQEAAGKPYFWDLATLLEIVADPNHYQQLLEGDREAMRDLAAMHTSEKMWASVQLTVNTWCGDFSPAAAGWRKAAEAGRLVDLHKWANVPGYESVLLVQARDGARETMESINGAIFHFCSLYCLDSREVHRHGDGKKESWFFLDEVAASGVAGDDLGLLVRKGRSKGCCIVLLR